MKHMAGRKKHSAEDIVRKLRRADELAAVGNVMRGGPSTDERLPFLMLGGDGDLRYFGEDNIAVDRHGAALPMFGRYGETRARLIEADTPSPWPDALDVLDARDVETHVLASAGARPWDYTTGTARDDGEQRRCYEAAIKTWANTPGLQGVFFWNWFPDGDRGYTPRGKPAEQVLRSWYRGD